LLESISEGLVICKNDEGPPFHHMSEVLDGLMHCQELAVVQTNFVERVELMGVKSQGLLSVSDTLLQDGANSQIRDVCK
jgi:hypothetical protein